MHSNWSAVQRFEQRTPNANDIIIFWREIKIQNIGSILLGLSKKIFRRCSYGGELEKK